MMISYYIIPKELKSVSMQALSMAGPDSKRSDTHSAVRALCNTRMEKDILGDFSTFHFAVALPSSNGRCSGWSWTRKLYPLLRTQTQRSNHNEIQALVSPLLGISMKTGEKRCVSAPCRFLTGREQKKRTKTALLLCLRLHYFCLFLFLSFTSHLHLDLKLGGNQLVFPRDDKSDS